MDVISILGTSNQLQKNIHPCLCESALQQIFNLQMHSVSRYVRLFLSMCQRCSLARMAVLCPCCLVISCDFDLAADMVYGCQRRIWRWNRDKWVYSSSVGSSNRKSIPGTGTNLACQWRHGLPGPINLLCFLRTTNISFSDSGKAAGVVGPDLKQSRSHG